MLYIASYHHYFFDQISFISRLFQHVMSLKYGNVLCGYASCGYVDIVRKIINKGTNDNAKNENRKMHLYLACRVILILFMVLNPLLQLISFCFINHELYKFV
jgi:hypothetical protein